MENHLYECLYESYAAMTLSLINFRRFNGAGLKLCVSAICGGKKSYSILTPRTRLTARNLPCSHIFKILRRRETRAIRQVQDLKGNIITRTRDVIDTFVTHLSQKYGPIDADSTSATICKTSYDLFVKRKTLISYRNPSPLRRSSLRCEQEPDIKHRDLTASV